MKSFTVSSVALLTGLISTTSAQTYTSCNPLNTTGCPSMEALGGNATFNWNKTGIPDNDKIWEMPNQGKIDWDEHGATFTIEESGDSPTANSLFYLLFGRVEVVMKVSTGTGIISSAILESPDLDEIDWEFRGDNSSVLSNYFGKGNSSNSNERGQTYNPDFAPQDDFHNYTLDWTAERLLWYVDGQQIRELKYADAANGTQYPQTPCNIRLGSWAAGDTTKNAAGVVEWAGGETDFSKGPFTMTIQTVYAKDYTSAKEYSWADMDSTGDWQKVKVVAGTSSILKEIQSPSSVKSTWDALSKTAKIGIIAGAIGGAALAAAGILFCCIKQRRAGRREAQALLTQEQKEAAELGEYKAKMQSGKFGLGSHRV